MRAATAAGAVALSVLSLIACSASSTDSDGDAPPPHRAFNVDDAVVAIVTPNGDPTYVCSAEVIGPRTILSAAHCFRGGNYDKTGWSFEVIVGANSRQIADGDLRAPVTEFRLAPGSSSEALDADSVDPDIAVAWTKYDLGVPSLRYRTSPPPKSLLGTNGRWAGYGAVEVDDKGTRHYAGARIEAIDPGTIAMSSTRGPCHGDSGGPLLARIDDDAEETILGVGHVAFDDCGGSANYTRTDLFADFIASNIR
jgi:V8-like Glu-specific endopeptidase